MRITFFSNFINHHQIPLSNAFMSAIGEDYTFVATKEVPEERKNMGYPSSNKLYKYVLADYENDESKTEAKELANDSDVVIIGSATDYYIVNRLKNNKITFRYCERYYRKGWNIRTFPRYFLSGIYHHRRFQNKPLYYLCSSAYTAADVNVFANFKGRQYKWGYFPEVKKYNIDELINKKKANKKLTFLWTARLLELKHPEVAVYVAERLKADGIEFEMNIIGDGKRKKFLKNLILEKKLNNEIHMLGIQTPDEVRDYMEGADIFLFTSDFNEGWGAVVNESMNSACAVVVSHAVGSAPFMIKNGTNGYIYKNGDIEDLYKKVRLLIDDSEHREEVQREAYKTMVTLWNADVAASRFITLCEAIKNGKNTPFIEGPCSIAESIKERDMYEYIMRNS